MNLSELLAHNQFNTSIWGDEGFSAILSMKSLPEIIKIIINDTSPPLWNISEWAAFQLFGTSEIVIRGLAFLFFVITLVFTFLITKRLWGKKSAIWTTALTFLNPFFFIYAFEGRMYSIMAAGVAGSMYFFLSGNLIGYVIMTAWALYSHHFAIFALMIQGVWFIYTFVRGKRTKAKRMLKGFIFAALLYIPWLYPLYLQTSKVGGGFWLSTPDVNDLLVLLSDYIAEGIKYPNITLPYGDYKLYQLALAVALVAYALRKWHKKIRSSTFMMLWFLGPILMAWGASQYFTSIFFNRYLLYTIPAAMILLGTNRRKVSNIVLVVLIGMFVIIDFNYFTKPQKLPFQEMAAYIDETRSENDFFVNWDAGSHHLWESKYYGFNAPIYVSEGGELPFYVGTALMEENDIVRSVPPDTTRIGVITSGSLESVSLTGFEEEGRNEIRGLKFVWLTKNGEMEILE
ncbi:hypothetical protein ACFL2C_01585 [Patescibacteria group bacterium]